MGFVVVVGGEVVVVAELAVVSVVDHEVAAALK